METELAKTPDFLPCPFCGGEASHVSNQIYVKHKNPCPLWSHVIYHHQKVAWNSRARPDSTSKSEAGSGCVPAPCSALDLGRLINSIPQDVLKKISLEDLHRITRNYNSGLTAQDVQATVFTREECIFQYCPHSELCAEWCHCPKKQNSDYPTSG